MDCREVERSITQFIHDKMNKDEIEEFVNHIYGCDSCKEEVAIQYLITEGMNRLEEGETFTLQEELDAKLEHARRRAILRKWMRRFLYVFEAATIIVAVLIVIILVLR